MYKMLNTKIKEATNLYGEKGIVTIAYEELAELVQASTKILRYGWSRNKDINNFIEECTDVIIICEWLLTNTIYDNNKSFPYEYTKSRISRKENLEDIIISLLYDISNFQGNVFDLLANKVYCYNNFKDAFSYDYRKLIVKNCMKVLDSIYKIILSETKEFNKWYDDVSIERIGFVAERKNNRTVNLLEESK